MTRTVFTGGRVFDGSGAPPADGDVAIEDGRIVAVGPGLDGDESVDCAGLGVLPGLIDCHVHVMAPGFDVLRATQTPFSLHFYEAIASLGATLRAGITTARDAGGADLGVKRAVADGIVAGPRLRIAITMLSQTGGHGDCWTPIGDQLHAPFLPPYPGSPGGVVDGADEMRRRVRDLVRCGADQLKVATSGGVLSPLTDPRRGHFRAAELDVLVEEATAAGRPVMAHAQATDGIKAAVRAGVASIEHGIYLDDEAIQMMLDRGTVLVPTLVAPRAVIEAAEAGAAIPAASVAKARETVEAHTDAFRRAVAAGVRIAMGTDSGVAVHGQNLRELALMAEGGMTPAAVLEATTRSAARLLGLGDELGTLEEGKRADLVLVDGDPLDVGDLGSRVRAVYQDGLAV